MYKCAPNPGANELPALHPCAPQRFLLAQAERRAAERANEEEFRRRMLERFAEEDRLEQMNMQAGAGGCWQGPGLMIPASPLRQRRDTGHAVLQAADGQSSRFS